MGSPETSLLPIDIIEEIFCSTPVEYLTQLKLTCRQWHELLKDKRFIYKYLDLVQERFVRVDRMVEMIDPLSGARSSSPIPEEFQDISEISTMVHCDGLLLCRCNNARSSNCKLAVWNPFLRRIKWIKPMDFYSSNDFYGFGFDLVSRDEYKILRIFDGVVEDENGIIGTYNPEIQIYDFKSDSWTTIDNATSLWSIDPPCKGVSVKGNMYWVAHWNNRPQTFIQCFDFSVQAFKLVSSLPFECGVLDTAALSSFKTDKLSLLHQRGETMKIHVWVSNKVDDEIVTWTKYLEVINPNIPTLHTDQHLSQPSYFIANNGSIMVWCEEQTNDEIDYDVCVSLFEIGKDGIVKKQVETGPCDLRNNARLFICGYVYVPSLVPVPE